MQKLGVTAVAAGVLLGIAGWSLARPDTAIRVATGAISHTLCSETFVSGLDPDRIYEDALRPDPGMWLIDWAVRYRIDSQRRQVTASVAGMFAGHAVYRDGMGCILVHGAEGADMAPLASALADHDKSAPRYSASKTLETGYGAGFWTNLGTGNVPRWGVPWGLAGVPRDAFFARGYLGQYVVVVPSERLVVVRFGMARNGGDTEGVARLVTDVIAGLSYGGQPGDHR